MMLMVMKVMVKVYKLTMTVILNRFRLLPCLSPLYENHSAVTEVDSALDTLGSAVGKHQVVCLISSLATWFMLFGRMIP